MRKHVTRGLSAAVAALALGLASAPAYAANRVIDDVRGDAPPRIDILSAKMHNGPATLSSRISVDNLLRRRSLFSFSFSPANSPDIAFVARTLRHDDGSIANQLFFYDDLAQRHRVPCDLRVDWQYADDIVRIVVPRECTKGISGRQWMGARSIITGAGERDQTPYHYVREG